MSPPPVHGVLEAILYAPDLDAALRFYRDELGLALASDMRPTALAFRISENQVLLIFDPRQSRLEGRTAPPHACEGRGHLALRIGPETLDAWRAHLRERNIAIEREVDWDGRGRSIYVRDTAGNSVELLTADIWP